MTIDHNEIIKLKQIKDSCTICAGTGYVKSNTNTGIKLNDCECILQINKQTCLLKANIPRRYWNWDFRSLTNQFKLDNATQYDYLKKYLENLEENIKNGNGIWLSSGPGLAKSSIISYILRESIKLNHVVYFSRASHIISKKFDALNDPLAKEFIDFIVNNVEVLALEEIEKVYLKSDQDFVNLALYELLSDIYDSSKVLLLSSNIIKKDVLAMLPPFIQDRLSTLQYLPLIGKYSGRHVNG